VEDTIEVDTGGSTYITAKERQQGISRNMEALLDITTNLSDEPTAFDYSGTDNEEEFDTEEGEADEYID